MTLKGGKALVTGGARGIGLELSRQLIEAGCHVVSVGRNAQDLKQLQSAHPGKVKVIVADLSLHSEVDALIVRLHKEHPDLNILINNAGIQVESSLFSDAGGKATALARKEIAVNLDGLISLTIGLLPILTAQKSAAVVNISSGLAIAPKAASPIYCATKAAVRSFTKALRYQCAGYAPHVRVSEAIMALVDTDMTAVRGSGKISAEKAAKEIIAGMIRQKDEIWVAKAKLLRVINRLSPWLAERIMR